MAASGTGGSGDSLCVPTGTTLAELECSNCASGNCCDALVRCQNSQGCSACAANATQACQGPDADLYAALFGCVAAHCVDQCSTPASGGSGGTGGSRASGGSGAVPNICGSPCGTDCCDLFVLEGVASECVDEGNGNLACAQLCARSSDCPATTPVCTLFADGSAACTVDIGGQRVCKTKADCSGDACAPSVNGKGTPGPYVCVPDDGAAYHGCNGALTFCSSGTCCFGDSAGNHFCAPSCATDSDCSGGTCRSYDNGSSTCTSTKGCGPG